MAQADLSLAEVKLLEEEGHKPIRLQLYADIKGERVESGLGYIEARPFYSKTLDPISCCALPNYNLGHRAGGPDLFLMCTTPLSRRCASLPDTLQCCSTPASTSCEKGFTGCGIAFGGCRPESDLPCNVRE